MIRDRTLFSMPFSHTPSPASQFNCYPAQQFQEVHCIVVNKPKNSFQSFVLPRDNTSAPLLTRVTSLCPLLPHHHHHHHHHHHRHHRHHRPILTTPTSKDNKSRSTHIQNVECVCVCWQSESFFALAILHFASSLCNCTHSTLNSATMFWRAEMCWEATKLNMLSTSACGGTWDARVEILKGPRPCKKKTWDS